MTLPRWTLLAAAFVAASAAVGAWADATLPEGARVAVHFAANGAPNGFASKDRGLFLLPAIAALVVTVLSLAPRIMPRGRNPVTMAGPYGVVVAAVAGVLFVSEAAIAARAMDANFDVLRAAFLATGVLLVVTGNLLGKVRHNWLIGVRTPWTLSDERVWDKTHRFTGRLMFAAGLALMPLSAFMPDHRWLIALVVTCAAGPALAGAVYSALIYPRAQVRS